uniref:NADH-ubiquinone oxidoreductase chain 4L n=1 Tax=Eumacrocentrus sp. QL-2013 TaxID=1421594 RepID=A0A0A6ZL56_9HYME|nr:NADH dehydrogenase subunit 4L [Eumacrocentrus sp. QL-2013]
MFEYNFNLSFMFFLMSCFMFSFFYKHLLLTLISLEFMMINILFNMYMSFMMLKMNLIILSFFLTISVCESIIGLSLLVFLVRISGNDFMKSLNLMKW